MSRPALAALAIALAACLPVAAQDSGWPVEIVAGDYAVTLYQPQVDSFTEDLIEGRAAAAVRKGGGEPIFGAVWLVARIATDRDTRNVDILTVEVPAVRFPEATEDEQRALADLLEQELPTWDVNLSLDSLLASLGVLEGRIPEPDLRNDPPRIIIANEPSLLVLIDGEARLETVEGSQLQRVVNTPFLVVHDPTSRAYYLSADEGWFSARSLPGPWRPDSSPPAEVVALTPPPSEPSAAGAVSAKDSRTPQIVVSTVPAELIFIDGPPAMAPIEDTDLLYVSNTDSDVVFDIAAQRYYVLLSGRWYAAGSLSAAEWSFVPPDQLPETFALIPVDSENGHVLANVAGTEQAREAALDAAVPQTAAVRMDATTSVEYDGKPRFERIPGTSLRYAVNTQSQVIKHGRWYYCCDEGVWYVAGAPTGPWRVCTDVPDEIYRIPASNPNHNVTYVFVYDMTPDVVYVGYTPGYVGSYLYRGCLMYGTGWYYDPWWGAYYVPRPWTWGFHVRYSPWWGWSFGYSYFTGPFHLTIGSFGPWGWWGPGWYRPYPWWAHGYGYRPGYHHGHGHGHWQGGSPPPPAPPRPPASATRPGPEMVPTNNIYARPANAPRIATTRDRMALKQPTIAQDRPNNVLTDRSGNVYRRNEDGTWDRRDPGGWSSTVDVPEAATRPTSGARATRPASPAPPSAGAPARPSAGTRAPASSTRARPSAGAQPQPSAKPQRPSYTRPSTGASIQKDYTARQQGTARGQDSTRSKAKPAAKPRAGDKKPG